MKPTETERAAFEHWYAVMPQPDDGWLRSWLAWQAGAAQQRETDAAICEAHDPTIDVYNSPLNGMRHPVAEQTAAACAAAIRAQQEAKG